MLKLKIQEAVIEALKAHEDANLSSDAVVSMIAEDVASIAIKEFQDYLVDFD